MAPVRKAIPKDDASHVVISGAKGPNDSRYGDMISAVQLRAAHESYRSSPVSRRVSIQTEYDQNIARSYFIDSSVLLAKVAEIAQHSRELKEYQDEQQRKDKEYRDLKTDLSKKIGYTDGYSLEKSGLKRCQCLAPTDDGRVRVDIVASIEGTPEQVRQTLDKLKEMGLIK